MKILLYVIVGIVLGNIMVDVAERIEAKANEKFN